MTPTVQSGLKACGKCGMVNPEEASFCMRCGSKLKSSRNGRIYSESETFKSSDLEAHLVKNFKMKPEEAKNIVKALLGKIRNALLDRRTVKLTNIGSFVPYLKRATQYRHPSSGKMKEAPPRTAVQFKLSVGLRDDLRDTDPEQ